MVVVSLVTGKRIRYTWCWWGSFVLIVQDAVDGYTSDAHV